VVFRSGNFNEAHFRLIDLTGKELINEQAQLHGNRWEVSTAILPENIYILLIETDFGVWKNKVLVK